MQNLTDTTNLEELETALRRSSVTFLDHNLLTTLSYMKSSNISYFLEYGCVILYHPSSTYFGKTVIRLIGLDNWVLRRRCIDGKCVQSSVCLGIHRIDLGDVCDDLVEDIKRLIKSKLEQVRITPLDKRSAGTGQGHQKTPAFIDCLLREAIATVGGSDKKLSEFLPYGGTTDVGKHTGGEARETNWPLIRAVLSDLLGEEMAHHIVVTYYLRLIEDNLNICCSYEVMELLQETVEIITEQLVLRFDCNVDAYAASVLRIRNRMEGSVKEESVSFASRFRLDDCQLGLKLPAVYQPASATPAIDSLMKTDYRSMALKAIGAVNTKPVISLESIQVFRDVLAWCTANPTTVLINPVIEDLFLQASQDLDRPRLDIAEIQAVVKLKDIYLSRMKRKGLQLETVCRSNRVLVEWICCCLVHRQCVLTYEHVKNYRLPLHPSYLSVLCVDTKEKQEAILALTDYIRKYKINSKYIFHPSHTDHTFEYAKQHFLLCPEMKSRFSQEEEELHERLEVYWEAVLSKKEDVQSVRRELKALEQSLVAAERVKSERSTEWYQLKRNAERANAEYNAAERVVYRDSYRGRRGRNNGYYPPPTQEQWDTFNEAKINRDDCSFAFDQIKMLYNQSCSECDGILNSIESTKSRINETLKPPKFVINPLPQDKEQWKVIIFFQEMPEALNILSSCLVACHAALTEPGAYRLSQKDKEEYDLVTKPKARPATTWAEHYNKYSVHRDVVNKNWLHYPVSYQLPPQFGAKSVDDMREKSYSFIYYPTPQSNTIHSSLKNPFDVSFEFIENFFTEYSDTLQFVLDYPSEDQETDRGNLVYSRLLDIPDGFTVLSLINLSSIRSFPNLQIRKLIDCLKGNSLPWSQKIVHDVSAMVLYQLGVVEGRTPLWKTDLWEQGFWNEMATSLRDRVEVLRETPRDHTHILSLSLIARFHASHTDDLSVTRALSATAVEWARIAHQELESRVDVENLGVLRTLRGKEALMVGYAILCQADLLEREDARDLLRWIVRFHHIVALVGELEGSLVAVRESVLEVVARKIHLIDSHIDDHMLTEALREAFDFAGGDLHWTRVDGSYCYESCCSAGPDQHYMINCLTGFELVNGFALNILEVEITRHESYVRIFGMRNFEVVRTESNVRRTRFPVNNAFHYEFVTGGADGLVIREIEIGKGIVLELVNIRKYRHGLPKMLRELYVHWWNREKGEIRLRPPAYHNREVKHIIDLKLNKCFLVPLSVRNIVNEIAVTDTCPVFLSLDDCRVTEILSKFENKEFIHGVWLQGIVTWELPRFQLSFSVGVQSRDSVVGEIQSREIIGFKLSQRQQLSDWTKTFSQYLVLENEDKEIRIIVPAGDVVKTGDEVTVSKSSSPDTHIEYYLYQYRSLTKDFLCSSVEARLHLACICAATSTALPERVFDMTGTEYALKLLRESWVHRPLHAIEISKLLCLKGFSYREPAILLLCDEFVKHTSEIAFLYDLKEAPLGSIGDTDDVHSAAAFQIREEIMVPRKNIARRGMTESELRSTVLWRPPKFIRSKFSLLHSLPDPPVPLRYIWDVESSLRAMVVSRQRPLEPLLLGRSTLKGQFVEELKLSQECVQKTPINQAPEHVDVSAHMKDVSSKLDSMFEYISHCLESAVDCEGKINLRLRKLASHIPLLRISDIMSIAKNKEYALHFNPYLSDLALQQLFTAAVTFLCLIVLKGKLSRISKGQVDLVTELLCVREWNPLQHPHWVVFEAEGGVQIRPEQYLFAKHLLDHPGAISQLTMGSGKTRVILPMIILEYLHKKSGFLIPRITILSHIIEEASDVLHQSLIASVFNLQMITQPFCRDVQLDNRHIEILRRIEQRHSATFKVVAPEHRLSLKLKALEMESAKNPLAKELQQFLSLTHYVDILDESDALLSHKYQLIYAVGEVKPLDHLEERSVAAQAILRILNTNTEVMKFLKESELALLDDSVSKGSFHKITLLPSRSDKEGGRISELRKQFKVLLLRGLASDPPADLQWITSLGSNLRERAILDNSVAVDEHLKTTLKPEHYAHLLSLRGLLASGILEAALEKRCHVNYGIDPKRKKRVAVPFRAADVPSTRSEFSHPDVSIILTILAYYYDGLTRAQLLEAMHHMLNIGLASREYQYKVCFEAGAIHNSQIDTVHKIDLTNEIQVEILYETFRYNTEFINFWLNAAVLRQDTGQYSERIVANAWDLSARIGFSGTKDNHMLLPLHVNQLEPEDPSMQGADAKMISLILKQRVVIIEHGWHNVLDEAVKYDALIDTGSLLAGVSMMRVAEIVLSKCLHRRGVAYFDDGWKVLDRSSGLVLPKSRSSLRDSECFVVFDEARCRGSDFKLASNAVGVITLGQGLCRDKFLQGAGRMRQLDRGQALVIVGTRDILRDSTDALHVVEWVLGNTASETDRGKAEWAAQGLQFYCDKPFVKEDWSLERLYASAETAEALSVVAQRRNVLGAEKVVERCIAFGEHVQVRNHEALEECERELQLEEEQQQEQIREISVTSPAIETSWEFATAVSAKTLPELGTKTYALGAVLPMALGWESFPVFATHNFLQTVQSRDQTKGRESISPYLRLASCVLDVGGNLVLLSDLEANGILKLFWKQKQKISRFQTVQSWLESRGLLRCLIGIFNGDTNFPAADADAHLELLTRSKAARSLLKDLIDMRGELRNWSCSDLQRHCDRTDYSSSFPDAVDNHLAIQTNHPTRNDSPLVSPVLHSSPQSKPLPVPDSKATTTTTAGCGDGQNLSIAKLQGNCDSANGIMPEANSSDVLDGLSVQSLMFKFSEELNDIIRSIKNIDLRNGSVVAAEGQENLENVPSSDWTTALLPTKRMRRKED